MSPSRPKRKTNRKTAIALDYDRTKTSAPKLVAKGTGLIADRLIASARENGVPIVENKVLVEALDQLGVNQQIPAELYQVVAEILVSVYKADERIKK